MAFLSGGSGGGTGSGMPPPPPPQQSAQQQQLAALAGYASNPQILEALLLQQQQAAVSSAPSSIINQLLATALLGGGSSLSPASAANSMALSSASQPLGAAASPLGQAAVTPQQQQASMLLQQLQTQLALSQLMPQMQQSAAAGGNALLNPAMAFYYQQLLQQQQQQQQQQSLLQQLQQHQQQQHQQAQSQPSAVPTPLQMSQQHSAFQPPQQAQASATGSVESQLNAQERLMNALQHHHNQQQQPNSIGISRREEQPQQAAAVPHAAAHDRGMMPTAAAPSRNNLNPKEVHDRITRIISENEQIVQPQEPLLKRRPYHRQVGQQSSIEQDSNSSSTRTSPGLRDGRMLQKTQSLYEPINGVRAFGGSLTSGQPVIRQQPLTQQPHVTPICTYCHVAFPNEAGLQVHELRCSKRLEGEKAARMDVAQASSSSAFSAPPADISDNSARHPLKRRLLAAVAAEQEANMAKLARKDSGEIIVVGETKAAKDHGEHAFHVPPALPRRATVATFPVVAHSAFAVPSTTSLPPTQSQQNQQPLITAPPPPQSQLTPSFGAAHPTAFTQVVSRAAAPQPAVIVPQPTPVSVAVNPAGTTASFQPPASIKAEPKRESGEEEVHNPFSMKDLVLTGSLDRPYTLVLSEGSKMANPDTLRNARNRGRNITSETFVCMHRAQPMFVEQKGNQGNLSMYSNWHQVSVNEADSKLNLLFMGMCSPKSRTGVHPFWKYTVANREMGNYKMTHSSFWEISQKLRLRQLAEVDAAPVKMEEDQTMDSKNAPTLAQKFEIKCDEIERSARSEFDPERPTSSQSFRDIEKKEPATSVPSGEDAFEFSASPPRPATAGSKKVDPVIGGHRTDEVYVYVRGRGRGRYVCDRCGIRCKKPSMLKKHIKSHTDVRPFKCRQCNFSFKTKGNLTKHLSSKTHRRKVQQGGDDSDGEDRLEIATPDDERMDESEEQNGMDDGQSCSSDEEDDHMNMMDEMEDYPFKKFGQENILWERSAHTPPSRWVLFDEEINRYWPDTVTPRQCSSAPPSALPSPPKEETKFVETVPFISQMLFVSTAAPSAVATSAPLAYTAASVPPLPPKIQTQPGAMIYSFMPREESLKCEQCDRTFRKASELTLHQHTHNLEKQQSKNRMFQCPECRIPLRTKALLAKHVESSHGSHVQIDDSVTANVDPYASTQSVLGGGATPVASNPRSFMCSDCNIGFRKHGILAKHLRSKTHVMKLETLKRLPEDSLSLITKRDNGACLNEVDTTDCEKARSSLLAIVEAIRAENQRAQVAPPAAVVTSSAVSNLECREQLAPSPVPAIAANRAVLDSPSNGVRSYSENSSPFRSRCGSAASTAESAAARKRSDSLFRPELNSLSPAIGIANGSKLISANVWVPPKSTDLPTNGVGANRGESGQFRAVHEVVAELKHDDMEDRTMCTSPVMRILATNGHAAPAIPPGTRCSFCEVNYDSPLDLQVHLYTDHLTIRDGTFFKCPKKFCGKVYPNKNCLRTHITAHYKVDTAEVREDDNVSSASLTVVGGGAGVEDGDQRASPASDASDSSTCHSPVMLDAPRTASSVESRTPSEEPLRLPCSICAEVFTDAASLQQHWFGHVSSRTHVCQVCDAGFTSSELLQHHSATHVNKLTNGSS